jgi:hypothetical protein
MWGARLEQTQSLDPIVATNRHIEPLGEERSPGYNDTLPISNDVLKRWKPTTLLTDLGFSLHSRPPVSFPAAAGRLVRPLPGKVYIG